MIDLVANPPVARAAVVGIFGGVGLALTRIYSRRGPVIYPVYAALLAALALLLARHAEQPFLTRAAAALLGFVTATAIAYVTVGVLAQKQRDVLIAQGRLPRASTGASALGHLWRWGLLLGVGAILSLGLAFIAA